MISISGRRAFLRLLPIACAGACVPGLACADDAVVVLKESDPEAVSLDYRADASKVDAAKFPKYASGQVCRNCSLYYGDAAAATAPCGLFIGKEVAAGGWCSAWEKK